MHVYLFSPIPYSFLHQRPQKIAEELRRQSVSVTFIEPYGFTEIFAGRKRFSVRDIINAIYLHVLALRDLVFHRTLSMQSAGSASVSDRDIMTFPLIIPSNRVNSEFLDRLNSAVLRAWLTRNIQGKRDDSEVVALVQQPYLGSVLKQGDFDGVYYDCIDDLSVFSGHGSRERLSASEDSLLDIADAIFVTSEALHEHIRCKRPGIRIVRIANGVDYDHFQEVAAASPIPAELLSIPKPVAGYVGILRAWFDASLIEALARARRDVTFVLVGPHDDTAGLRRLKECPNVILTGRKAYDDIPAYIRSFDVCLIPFRQGEIAETTNPVKVFEYFALGKPVLSTWLRELIPYAERGLLRMAKTGEEFPSLLREILDGKDGEKEEERRAVAMANSWKNHVQRLIATMQREDGAQ